MTVTTVRPVDPDADGPLLHRWVTAPRAAFWGMQQHSLDDVVEVYRYIGDQPHLRALLAESDGQPLALLQTYDPTVDEIGAFYDRRPGDVGMHLLLADDPARAGRTPEILDHLLDAFFGHAAVQRLVFEPDAGNEKSLALLRSRGAEPGPQVHLVLSYAEKDAQFWFFPREGWSPRRSGGATPAAADLLPATF